MDYIKITGYKSLRKVSLELSPVNILIGSNGSGKSNFLSFFDFLNHLYEQKLQQYINEKGGPEKMLFQGPKVTEKLSAEISFSGNANGYSFELYNGHDGLVFNNEAMLYKLNKWDLGSFRKEAVVKFSKEGRGKYVNQYLQSFRKYHFHDTGKNSPFNNTSHIENNTASFYQDGGNLAAFLYEIGESHTKVYQRIIKTIQSIAPYFSDFHFYPNKNGYLKLQWQDKYSSVDYGVNDLSDGTIRFIALTTLFLQPNLPDHIIIDEPELGLHPVAIGKLAGMIQSAAARGSQVIVATQSADLVNHFMPEDIITVNQIDGESVFKRLEEKDLEKWLDEYSIGDLWQRNILQGGQPT